MGLAAATTAEAEDIVEALFTTPEGTSNPYPLYTRLRALAPHSPIGDDRRGSSAASGTCLKSSGSVPSSAT